MAPVHSAMRGTGGRCPCNASSGAHCSVGAHAFSRDGLAWPFSKTVAYNATHALPESLQRLRTRPPPAHLVRHPRPAAAAAA